MMRSAFAQAKPDGMIIERLGAELVVYDTASHQAHALDASAQAVWEACDGRSSTEQIAMRAGIDPIAAAMAVERLRALGLVDGGDPLDARTRRSVLGRAVRLGASAVVAVPVISTVMVAPAFAGTSTGITVMINAPQGSKQAYSYTISPSSQTGTIAYQSPLVVDSTGVINGNTGGYVLVQNASGNNNAVALVNQLDSGAVTYTLVDPAHPSNNQTNVQLVSGNVANLIVGAGDAFTLTYTFA